MFVTCDTCGESFDVQKEVKTVKRKIKGSSVENKFFVCPTCGKKYIFSAVNKRVKFLIEERKRLYKQISIFHNDNDMYQKCVKSIEECETKLNETMNELIRVSEIYI